MRRINILLLLFITVFLFSSCKEKSVTGTSPEERQAVKIKSAPALKLSEKAKNLLSNFENILHEQEDTKKEEEKQKAALKKEGMIQITINQTLEELLSKDPAKDAQRINELIEDLKDIGAKSVKAIKDMLSENRPARERILLLKALGIFKGKEAQEELYKQAMGAPERDVQEAARQSLKNAPAKEEMVRETIKHIQTVERSSGANNSPQEQMRAIGVLGVLGGDEALAELSNILRKTEDANVRQQAVVAIGEIDSDNARSMLQDIFKNDEIARASAAQAMGKMKREDIVLYFGEILSLGESAPAVKAAAVQGLGADNDKLARTILINVLRDTRHEREVHEKAVIALNTGFSEENIGEVPLYISIFEATPVDYLPQMLQPLLANGGDYVAGHIRGRYGYFTSLKKIHAIRTLGRIQRRESYEVLTSLLEKESDSGLKLEVIDAIQKFKDKEFAGKTADILRKVLDEAEGKREKMAALKYLGDLSPDEASKTAEEWLTTSADDEMLVTSIEILKKFGDKKSKIALLAFKTNHGGEAFDTKIDDAVKTIEIREKR